jgi:hypothetical protein
MLIADPSKQVGEFQEVTFGEYFSYRSVEEGDFFPDRWIKDGFDKVLILADNNIRLCKVIRTRCYVVIDEDCTGNPVVVPWKIRKHVISSNF